MIQVNLFRTDAPLAVSATGFSPQVPALNLGPRTLSVALLISSVSSANISCQLEGSNDGVNFFPLGTATVVTANGVYPFKETDVAYAFYHLKYTVTGGSFTATPTWLVYGERI